MKEWLKRFPWRKKKQEMFEVIYASPDVMLGITKDEEPEKFSRPHAGPDIFREFPEEDSDTIISKMVGRDPSCEIRLTDIYAARCHCEITRSGNRYYIQDHGSTNGTYVNGQKLDDSIIEIYPGDTLTIGKYTYSFEKRNGDMRVLTFMDGVREGNAER